MDNLSYEELITQFKLEEKQHLWKDLQIRDCLKSQIGCCGRGTWEQILHRKWLHMLAGCGKYVREA